MAIKKRCAVCGNSIKMRKDGTFYDHAEVGQQRNMTLVAVTSVNRCGGAKRKPEHAEAIAKDRAERTDLHVGVGK